MYGLHEFIPNGCFLTGNPVPYNTDVRDMTYLHTDKNQVTIKFGDPTVHIVTRDNKEAKSMVKRIFDTIARGTEERIHE